MYEYVKPLKDYPDISFIDNDTLQAMRARVVERYEEKHSELSGRPIVMSPSDPQRATAYAYTAELYQMLQLLDRAGKRLLLKYADGDHLENLGAILGVSRNGESAAETTIRFTLSTERPNAISIPAGTRVSNSNLTYFITKEYAEVPIGQTFVDVVAVCVEEGVSGNELLPGQLNTLVDLIPYVDEVKNLDTTQGGAGIEDDESLRERIFLAPSKLSVAGPDDAYTYWVKTFNSNIGDVNVYSPTPAYVEIRFLLKDGTLPTETLMKSLEEYLLTTGIRPLTDKVSVLLPGLEEFNIDMDYYINTSDMTTASTIQKQVDAAIEEYIEWQTGHIGRDINPSELTKKVVAAGAKRVEIREPEFKKVDDTCVPRIGEKTVSYGGLEDD